MYRPYRRVKESELQKQCIQYLKFKNIRVITSFTGVYISSYQTKRFMKQQGLEKGIPDLFIPYSSCTQTCARKSYHGLFVELKIKPNKPTIEQLEYIDFLKTQNYQTEIIYCLDAFILLVDNYFYKGA